MPLELAGHTRLSSLPDDPFALFSRWRERAAAAPEVQYPDAMCLSTVSAEGLPQGRFVIAHPQPDRTFVFLTDARSPKARALAARSVAALTAYWGRPLELQVRIEGVVEDAEGELVDAIFARRPAPSRLTPWVSRQSAPATLDELATALERRAAVEGETGPGGAEGPPRPATWVGFRLLPRRFEFWEARSRRLHDRFLYTREAEGRWSRVRLAP